MIRLLSVPVPVVAELSRPSMDFIKEPILRIFNARAFIEPPPSACRQRTTFYSAVHPLRHRDTRGTLRWRSRAYPDYASLFRRLSMLAVTSRTLSLGRDPHPAALPPKPTAAAMARSRVPGLLHRRLAVRCQEMG